MKPGSAVVLVLALTLGAGQVQAQAQLENPAQGSHQSGIGLVSGWSCTRPDGIEIDGALHPLAYGTPRADVLQAGACGDANVGFGLLVNWANFGAGAHSARLRIGGAAAGPEARFTVAATGQEFLRGLEREVAVPDFPAPGQTTTLAWQEARQNFAIKAVTARPAARHREVVHTQLRVDLASRTATAIIDLAATPQADTPATLEAGDLEIRRVGSAGRLLPWRLAGGRMEVDLQVPAHQPVQLSIDYAFRTHEAFDGLLPSGATFAWPYHCGNLFPCRSDPADGTSFDLVIAGTPPGQVTVHAPHLATAPAYQLAWATGDYRRLDVGTTPSGTRLVAYALPGEESAARSGTALLPRIMAWYETTYGPYPFGREAGPVAVRWNGGYGGMEHHPYWHVATAAMGDALVHAHEAAHGWIGAGVRLACWEDFALSEGTASYLAARAMGEAAGDAAAARVWDGYRVRLEAAMAAPGPKIAWPDGCGRIDVLKDGLYGDLPYVKGAFFWRALELRIGRSALDGALRAFLRKYRYQAAGFADALATVLETSGYDAAACARDWLKREVVPDRPACP